MKKTLLATLLVASFPACPIACREATAPSPAPTVTALPAPSATPSGVSTSPSATPSKAPNCTLLSESVKTKWGARSLPGQGKFVTESHYATKDETFSGKLFPKTQQDSIQSHLQRSCSLLKTQYGFGSLSSDCHEIYKEQWHKEFTPPEGGGVAGQAARENLKPTREQELWQGNMMYADGGLPAPGTKYIAKDLSTGRRVVVSMGYEIGPEEKEWYGGLTTEVKWALGDTDDVHQILLGRAVDQTLPYGPLKDCP